MTIYELREKARANIKDDRDYSIVESIIDMFSFIYGEDKLCKLLGVALVLNNNLIDRDPKKVKIAAYPIGNNGKVNYDDEYAYSFTNVRIYNTFNVLCKLAGMNYNYEFRLTIYDKDGQESHIDTMQVILIKEHIENPSNQLVPKEGIISGKDIAAGTAIAGLSALCMTPLLFL